MTEITIANATQHISDLITVLDNAYWEASSVERKDLVYSIITLLNSENIEISKLSIQDHGLPYEPISREFYELKNKLALLRKMMDEVVIRHSTARELDRLIPPVSSLIT